MRASPANAFTTATGAQDLRLQFAFDGELGDVLRSHYEMDVQAAQLSKKFKTYYHLRPFIPLAVRQLLQRKRNRAMDVADDWYLPRDFLAAFRAALLRIQHSGQERHVIHPWPDGAEYSVVLTHDVETQAGCRLVSALATIEEQYGLRSAWNFIPHKYQIDRGLLSDLKDRGHEIGVHGYNHDGRLFTSRKTFAWRASRINQAIARMGCTGFRAPMVHRNLAWLQALNVDYDASCFDVDPFQAMPGGVGGVWPFIAGKFVELPYTLPQDHTLLIALGETTPRIWFEKLKLVQSLSGMALLVTHPDYLDIPQRLDVYRQFLEHLAAQQDGWRALPRDVAGWWRQREKLTVSSNCVTCATDNSLAIRGRAVSLCDLFSDFVPQRAFSAT